MRFGHVSYFSENLSPFLFVSRGRRDIYLFTYIIIVI